MFELLCTVRTQIGQRRLASYLLHPPDSDETSRRQEAVQELQSRQTLREEIALLGGYDNQESSWDTFTLWLDTPLTPFHGMTRIVVAVLASGAAALGLGGLLGLASANFLLSALIPLVVVEGILALVLLKPRIFNLMFYIPTFQRPSASLFIGARAR